MEEKLSNLLNTLMLVYEQQLYMYENRKHNVKTESVAMMEQRYGVTGADRKTLVAVISTITGIDARYL